MKAQELMLGDWVTIQQDPINHLRVVAINNDYIEVADEDNHGGLEEYPPKALYGIPLTPEILEKNGFEFLYSSVPGGTPQEQRMRKVDTYKWQGIAVNYYHETNDFQMVNFRGVRFDYVHQLQHALRLCGIEKEIKL